MKDRRLLSLLDMDARAPMKAIARKARLSRQVAEYRVRRLKERGIASGAYAIFDSCAAGFKWYRVILSLCNITKSEKEALMRDLEKNRFIFWLGEVGGNWDIAMNFICRDHFQFNQIFEEFMQRHGKHVKRHEILIYIDVHDLSRGYILPSDAPRQEFYHAMGSGPPLDLDGTDKGIIRLLSKDAAASDSWIAKRLRISAGTVRGHIRRMKEKKLILGFRLFMNPSKLGYRSHMAFFEINSLEPRKEREMLEYLKSVPNVTFVVRQLGKWRFGMEIETMTEEEFQEIFVGIRSRFSDTINGYESFPLFSDRAVNYFPEGNLD